MDDNRANEIIDEQKALEAADANYRSRCQTTADYIFPRESNITDTSYSTISSADTLYDVTAIEESENMASGLLTNLIPAGQKFFGITIPNGRLQETDTVKNYLGVLTEITHEEIFSSNFILQGGETLRSLITFGTGNSYSEWKAGIGLNYTDWDVARYQCKENFQGVIDTNFLKFPKTALQAVKEWGEDKVGKSVLEAFKSDKPEKKNEKFWFIHCVRPREKRNPRFTDFLNMKFESVYIAVKDKHEIDEGGFDEFPYAVPRWLKTTGEVHGRGIGTQILPQVKVLNRQMRDFMEIGNKQANPPRYQKESFEGQINVTPGGTNEVMEKDDIGALDGGLQGNPVITEKVIEMQREVIKRAFYHSAFAPLTDLTGDRRNQLEIRARIQEAFRRIGSPIGRIQSEWFNPQITRSILLLIRNGVAPPPPPELRGQKFKIVYKGPLSLELESAEVRAAERWIGVVGEMEEVFPGAADNISTDNAVRRMGRTYGVNEEDIASEEEVAQKRQQRAQEAQRQQALETAQVAAQGYGQTVKAPEKGSAAEQLQGATK